MITFQAFRYAAISRFSLVRVVTLIACVAQFPVSAADANKKKFEVPAGDAAVTLKQFSEQSGTEVVYMVDNVRGEKTRPVSGMFVPRDALLTMLDGTALVSSEDSSTGALVIGRKYVPDPKEAQAEPSRRA